MTQQKTFRYPTISADYSIPKNWVRPNASFPEDITVTHAGSTKPLRDFHLIDTDELENVEPFHYRQATFEDISNLIGKQIIEIAEKNSINVIRWEYDERNLLPLEVDISQFSNDPESCLPLKNMFLLSNITDIANSIQRQQEISNNSFQNFLDRIARRTIEHFRNVWSEYRDIEFQLRLNANKIVPAIKELNSYNFSKRSDGFKRFVTFLLMISVNVKTDNLKNTMLLIDEPEIGLHPSGARYLRDEMIHVSKKNYVIYSTHSIFMVDPGDISRHYIVKKQKEITTIDTVGSSNIRDEEVIFNALGHSIFSILREKNFIFEGWKDKHLFNIAQSRLSEKQKKVFKEIGACHANGAKHIKSITPMIELAGRECLIISDSDKPAKDQQKLFRKEKGFGEWYIYQEIDPSTTATTGEDFIKNAYISERINLIGKTFAFPIFSSSDHLEETNKIASIESWYQKNGLVGQELKDIVRQTKDSIFDNLRPNDIENSYLSFLKCLSEKIA